ncbi:MAG TPA: energy transducer TonB [Methylotenera sp.]|nr:energy transducer TonB [Methylotenera sp.]HQS43895.1 energy transducer TonB [Methylotenera sp.]
MNPISLSASMPNIQLVVNNASVKFESLKSIAISAPAPAKNVQKNTAFLPAVLLSVVLHLLMALVLFQKNPTYTPASTSLPMMVSFVHENKAQTPIETPPTEIQPTPLQPPVKPTAQLKQKIVANTSEKAAVLATEQSAELKETADLLPVQNVAQQVAEPTEVAAPNPATPSAAPVKAKPVYIAPSFGADYLHNPIPEYPSMARRKGEQGRVLLKVLVTLNGDAGNVTLEKSSGSSYLDEAAINAVKNWKFIPARSNNEAVSGFVTVPISFSLES